MILSLFISCSSNYHDHEKRNVNWSYYQKNGSSNGEWIKVKTIKIHKDGIYKTFYPNGKIYESTTYFKNKKHGDSKIWYENGNLAVTKHFYSGLITGEYKRYFRSGVLEEKIYYIKGKRNGDEIYYYKNGQISSFGKVLNGQFEGNWIKYDKKGNVLFLDSFSLGKKIASKKY